MPDPDEVELERLLAGQIKAILETVEFKDGGGPMFAHVHTRERFPSNDKEDEALFAGQDPVLGDKMLITNVVEIGIPIVSENEYTADTHTELTFEYPIVYSLGVVDIWDKDGFEFNSSGEMAIAAYMRARRKFKGQRDLGLGDNVTHYYLQQISAGTTTNDKGEAIEHSGEWSLTVNVRGVEV